MAKDLDFITDALIAKLSDMAIHRFEELRNCQHPRQLKANKSAFLAADKVRVGLISLQAALKRIEKEKKQ